MRPYKWTYTTKKLLVTRAFLFSIGCIRLFSEPLHTIGAISVLLK